VITDSCGAALLSAARLTGPQRIQLTMDQINAIHITITRDDRTFAPSPDSPGLPRHYIVPSLKTAIADFCPSSGLGLRVIEYD